MKKKLKESKELKQEERNFVAKAMFESGNEFSCKIEVDRKKEMKKGKIKHKKKY